MKLSLATFVARSEIVHAAVYNYSESNYVNVLTKLTIICTEHGEFKLTPSYHMLGHGCPVCKQISLNKLFILKAKVVHSDRYTYNNVCYKNAMLGVNITCHAHGDFIQTPDSHLHGHGCPMCKVDSLRSSTEDFIFKARLKHGDAYEYSNVNYKHHREYVWITCKVHGDFYQAPSTHLSGSICPRCASNNYSSICIKWIESVMYQSGIFIQHAENIGEYRIPNTKFRVDGYHKLTNTVYEFHGAYWHGDPNIYTPNTYNTLMYKTMGELYQETIAREQKIKELGYNLVVMWESDYNKNLKQPRKIKMNNKEMIKQMLTMQNDFNCIVNTNWKDADYAWHRAMWVECAELLSHHGYKWWKKEDPDWDQINLEIVDIWHFGLSMLLLVDLPLDRLVEDLDTDYEVELTHDVVLDSGDDEVLTDILQDERSFIEKVEALASGAVYKEFYVDVFFDIMLTAGLTLEMLFDMYVGKNVLNQFRQSNGYKQGTYRKMWHDGREDNEHLSDIMKVIKLSPCDNFMVAVLAALQAAYDMEYIPTIFSGAIVTPDGC